MKAFASYVERVVSRVEAHPEPHVRGRRVYPQPRPSAEELRMRLSRLVARHGKGILDSHVPHLTLLRPAVLDRLCTFEGCGRPEHGACGLCAGHLCQRTKGKVLAPLLGPGGRRPDTELCRRCGSADWHRGRNNKRKCRVCNRAKNHAARARRRAARPAAS